MLALRFGLSASRNKPSMNQAYSRDGRTQFMRNIGDQIPPSAIQR